MNFQVEGYIGAILEINLFMLLSSKIKKYYQIDMGNSILGGDSVFPAGPDLMTLAVQPKDTSEISSSQPFIVSGKLSWKESQT